MRHPFDGVISDPLTRRGALGILASGLIASSATAQVMAEGAMATTLAVGEEGGRLITKALAEAGGPATALANEAGGATPVTSEPFGEEAGKVVSKAVPGLEDGGPPTKADKENGQGGPTNVGREGGGVVSSAALGEEGGAVTAVMNEVGGPTTRAVGEGGGVRPVAIVPVQPNTLDLNEAKLLAAWKDMAERDPSKGVQACALLYGSKTVIPFLTQRLKPGMVKVPKAEEATLVRLITDLDDDDFQVREKAEAELSNQGATAVDVVEKALDTTRSAEVRMRLLRVRDAIKNPAVVNQALRAFEVLIALRTPEAKELLINLAKGEETDWVTLTAKASLQRASK